MQEEKDGKGLITGVSYPNISPYRQINYDGGSFLKTEVVSPDMPECRSHDFTISIFTISEEARRYICL